jgi:HD-like signal output (HDOD) protein
MLDHQALVRYAQQLDPLPPSVGRLAALVAEPEVDLDAIIAAVSYDPVLTGQVVFAANSAFSSPRHRVGTAKDAVIRLGAGAVLCLAVGGSARPVMERVVPAYGLSRGELWRHSVAAALAAETAGGLCGINIPPAAFTASLLHDIGKPVLGHFFTPQAVIRLKGLLDAGHPPQEAEVEVLSVHHGQVSGLIARHWRLPEPIVRGVTLHHAPADPAAGGDILPHVTALANHVAHRIGLGRERPGEADVVAQSLPVVGMSPEGLATLADRVSLRREEVSSRYR